MAKLLRRASAIAMAIYCGVSILTMQLPTAHAHDEVGRSSLQDGQQQWSNYSKSYSGCSCAAGKAPENITLYNYLSIQGPNSTTGYNTVQCGGPATAQPNGYGRTFCFDMPLLEEQDLSAKLLGVVQGTYVFISLVSTPATLFVTETFTLNTSSTPQGSFSASGLEYIRQVTAKPITGGTDAFAFLTGVAITTPLGLGVDSNGNLFSWFKYVFTFRSTSCA